MEIQKKNFQKGRGGEGVESSPTHFSFFAKILNIGKNNIKLMRKAYILPILFFVILVSLSSVSFAVDVTDCQNITTPGTYYLVNDILNSTNSTCISIQADNVIFDCQGHIIDGNDTSNSKGIEFLISTDYSVVKNCEISDWYYGIYLGGGMHNNITNTTTESNYYGIYEDGGYGATYTKIWNITTKNNEYGIELLHDYDVEFYSSILFNNTCGIDVYVFRGGGSHKIYNNLFNNTNNWQITGTYGSSWNTTKTSGTNIVGGPYIGGNYWTNSTGNGFSDTCTDSDNDGICDTSYTLTSNNIDYLPLATYSTSSNQITDCTTISTSGYYTLMNNITDFTATQCFYINASDVIFDCQGHMIDGSYTSGDYAFYLDGVTNVTIKNCIIQQQRYDGVYFGNSNNNKVINVSFRDGGSFSDAMYFSNSVGNIVENSTICGEDTEPIYHTSSCDNQFINVNGCNGNPILFYNSSILLSDSVLDGLILCNAGDSSITNVTVIGGNSINNNYKDTGVMILGSFSNITLRDMNITGFRRAIYSTYGNNVSIYDTTITNVDLGEIIYTGGGSNWVISNVSIQNLKSQGTMFHMNYLSNSLISNISLSVSGTTDYAFKIYYPNNLTIENLDISGYTYYDLIYISGGGPVKIDDSNIGSSGHGYSIYIGASPVTITGCTIPDTIYIKTSGNYFYNNLFNCTNCVSFGTGVSNYFNLTWGNYWTNSTANGFSDTCSDTNNDGICDSSYSLDANNVDYLPLNEYPFVGDQAAPSISDVTTYPPPVMREVIINLSNYPSSLSILKEFVNISADVGDNVEIGNVWVMVWDSLNNLVKNLFLLRDGESVSYPEPSYQDSAIYYRIVELLPSYGQCSYKIYVNDSGRNADLTPNQASINTHYLTISSIDDADIYFTLSDFKWSKYVDITANESVEKVKWINDTGTTLEYDLNVTGYYVSGTLCKVNDVTYDVSGGVCQYKHYITSGSTYPDLEFYDSAWGTGQPVIQTGGTPQTPTGEWYKNITLSYYLPDGSVAPAGTFTNVTSLAMCVNSSVTSDEYIKFWNGTDWVDITPSSTGVWEEKIVGTRKFWVIKDDFCNSDGVLDFKVKIESNG